MEKKTILLVEDNPDDIKMTLRALRKSNVRNEVVVAKDGLTALDYLFGTGAHDGRNTDLQPQVVLLDINMPKLNGLEVLQKIRGDARTRLLPVVIMTTSNEDKDRVDSYRLGCNSYIRKPVDFDQFARAVQQLGTYWTSLNETP